MIIVMRDNATKTQIADITQRMLDSGLQVHPIQGAHQTILGIIGEIKTIDTRLIEAEPGVSEVLRISEPYKLAGRHFHPHDTHIRIGDITIGDNEVIVMAGPCSIESEEQIHTIARHVKKSGAKILRGGAFKPRTSPYSFQGLGKEGLAMLQSAALENNMITISEIMDTAHLEILEEYVDILQIGARNMQNFALLKDVGQSKKAVFLKRGLSATIEELLMAAEYVMAQGNQNVILCERGIRTFETYTRNTMDISAIPVVKERSHLPMFADPSHGTGKRDKVAPLARAAVAAGADGLMIEVHNEPEKAKSDGAQSLLPSQFETLMQELKIIAWAIGRKAGNNGS